MAESLEAVLVEVTDDRVDVAAVRDHADRESVCRLRERRGARMTALTSGGTIPETGDYTVMLDPQAQKIYEQHMVEFLGLR